MLNKIPSAELIKTSIFGRVATIQLNRPEVLNALNTQLMREMLEVAQSFDADPKIGCIIITGNEKAFAAGADILELAEQDYTSMYASDFFASWDQFAALRIPKIAAVSGYALGGGCELAMMCDIILAAENAHFGQPEVKIGCIPGMGGSQRLTRLIGRARAMDIILTGRMIDAQEAYQLGLISRLVPDAELHDTAIEVAQKIASYAKDITMMARTCVREAEEGTLTSGLRFERQMYHSLYGLAAQKEGMAAFIGKRAPDFHS